MNTRNFENSRDDNNDNFRQGDNNFNRRSCREPPQGYDDSPPRDDQGDNRRQQDTSNRGNRNTDRRQYNENQYEDERATESRTTPRASIRGTDNSRLLESRDTRIPENVGTVTRTADCPRKRASPPQEGPTSRKRQASPPGSPERPTYIRTFARDTDYNPNPNESSRKFHGKFGFLPHSPWILQTSWNYPQRIASSITSCKQQRSELQGAVSTPMQRTQYDRRYHGIYMIVRHRSTYPRYRLPHPVRPLQRL